MQKQAVRGITDIINNDGVINLDFRDIERAMKDKGTALIGIGEAEGEGRAVTAAKTAVESKLLDSSIETAQAVIVNIVGSVTAGDMTDIEEYFKELIGDKVNFYLGVRDDENMGDKLSVTVIATGISDSNSEYGFEAHQAAPASQPARFGTANIPSLDSVGYNPSPAPTPVSSLQPISERQIGGQMRTVNPSSFSAGNIKPRVENGRRATIDLTRKAAHDQTR